MADLPTALYDGGGSRALDRAAIAGGIDSFELMWRAGSSAWRVLRERWPEARRLLVLCGSGNNGGDGYVIATLAARARIEARVVRAGEPTSDDARRAAQESRNAGVASQPLAEFLVDGAAGVDVIVDAIFGTGLTRAPEGDWFTAIDLVNRSGLPVLAIDVPSGVNADTGAAPGIAVRADLTVTFIGVKVGLMTGAGSGLAGDVVYARLEVPDVVLESVAPVAIRLCRPVLAGLLRPRPRDAHKGDYGHVLVIGGELGMGGAARMAAEAAARAGAGLVTVATRDDHAPMLNAVRPELMVRGVGEPSALAELLAGKNVIAVGPGLGQGKWGRGLWNAVRGTQIPKVVDADALNLLAMEPTTRTDWVLTPHPGEAARLLECRSADVQADRLSAAATLRERFGGVCVLKGAGTVIAAHGNRPMVCDAGNPGMASGGMGDVLTGIIAGLMAQGLAPERAAWVAVWAHAVAADDCAKHGGEIGLLATDLLAVVRRLLNGIAAGQRA
jgi:NAD(P)H-hydrate epimerase